MSRTRILLTGGAGFLGHHFVEHLLKTTDWDVVILDKLNYASRGFDRLRDVGCYDDHRVHRLACDFVLPLVDGVAREIGDVSYIFHVGAETHVDNSITNPESFVMSNVVGTFRMLEFARRLPNLERFFYFSTDEVFGPAAQLDASGYEDGLYGYPKHTYREWDRYNSTNPYSATKAGGEELCLAWANTYGVPLTITHCMNLFGERQHPEKFIPSTINKVRQGETVIIHSNPTGRYAGSRFYLHARNAADAVMFLVNSKDVLPRDKFNIVGQHEVDNLEMAQAIADIVGMELRHEMVDFHSSRPGHDLRYALDGAKLASLGWRAPVHFDTSLDRTVKWFLQNPKWLEV